MRRIANRLVALALLTMFPLIVLVSMAGRPGITMRQAARDAWLAWKDLYLTA